MRHAQGRRRVGPQEPRHAFGIGADESVGGACGHTDDLAAPQDAAGATLADKHGLPISDYSPHGGAFPLTVAGAGVIGSITASGLPQRADHEFVVEALCAELGQDYAVLALARS